MLASVAVLLWAIRVLVAAGCSTNESVSHWLYSSEIDLTTESLLERDDIVGVQLLYSWKSLERAEGKYDLAAIQRDVDLVHSKGKKLWIQLQDRTFSIKNVPTPAYMQTPLYNNDSVPTCDSDDCEMDFKQAGWMAAQWNPHVRERYQALLHALASALDGRIEGINLPETAVDVDTTKDDYNSEAYFQGELENAGYAASVFAESLVVQYVNFWPDGWADDNGYLTKSFEFYAQHGIGVGGPDLIPFSMAQEKNSYPLISEYRDRVPISVIAVQEPDLTKINPHTGQPFTKEEFVDYARNRLGIDIIYWATSSPWLQSTTINHE